MTSRTLRVVAVIAAAYTGFVSAELAAQQDPAQHATLKAAAAQSCAVQPCDLSCLISVSWSERYLSVMVFLAI